MIAFCLDWSGEEPPRHIGERMASSLAIGTKYFPQFIVIKNALIASANEKKGWKPKKGPCGRVFLFNGYIQNRLELSRELGVNITVDEELYAFAYARWGNLADEKVIGHFSTISWLPEHGDVRLSRSPIHAPPLHVFHNERWLIAASTPRAIFATGIVEPKLDEHKIADSLFLNYYEADRSWFENLSRLPSGSRGVITREGRQFTRYYDLLSLPPIHRKCDEDYVEEAHALVKESVAVNLRGFSQPSVSLSGGFDSQAIAAYAIDLLEGKPLQSFTSVPEQGWEEQDAPHFFGDERDNVAALATMYPALKTEWVDAAGLSFGHRLDAFFLLASAPPRNVMNFHWIHEICAKARQRGCDVLLSGEMGNATFSFGGEGAFPNWFREGRWLTMFQELSAIGNGKSLLRNLLAEVINPLLPERAWLLKGRLRGNYVRTPYETWCPLNPDWAAKMRVEERARDMGYDFYYRPVKSTREWRAGALSDFSNEGADVIQAFEILHGLPMRFPLIYRPLLEFCFGLPDNQFLRGGQTRWLARRMLDKKVPQDVLRETRWGLQSADWSRRLGREKHELESELRDLAADTNMTRRLDVEDLQRALAAWSDDTPLNPVDAARLRHALVRGVTTSRFIRYINKAN